MLHLALTAAASLALAQVPAFELDTTLDLARERHGAPALGAALIERGEIRFLAARGLRRVGGRETVTTEDRWHFAAGAPPMTAALAARLVEGGALDWTTHATEIFAEAGFKLHDDYRELTFEQLLGHRGGLPFLPRAGLREALERTGLPAQTQRLRIAEDVLGRAPITPPGTMTVISHAGYAIAGAMMETRLEVSYEKLLEREILKPLGLESIGFGAPGIAVHVNEPWGHLSEGDELVPIPPGPDADLPAGFAPAGTLHGRLADWARFADWYLAALRKEPTLLSAQSFGKLLTPLDESRCTLGWTVTPKEAGVHFSQAGGNRRWYASLTLVPNSDAAVLVACNRGDAAGAAACREVSRALLDQLGGPEPQRP